MIRHKFKAGGCLVVIPWQRTICFEEVPGAVVEIAKDVGEAAAQIENLTEQQEQTTEQVENLEQRQRWNDQEISSAFERLWDLESKVNDLAGRVEILEAAPAAEPEPEPAAEPEETTIAAPEGAAAPAAAAPPAEKKKTVFSLF